MSEEKSIQITDPDHLITLGTCIGLLTAIQAIEKVKKETPNTPGIGIARHAVIAEEASMRIRLMQENLRLAYKTFGSIEGYGVKVLGDGTLTLEPDDPTVSAPAARSDDD